MKRFKQFLTERTTLKTKRWLSKRAKPYEMWLNKDERIGDSTLPISGPMMKRLGISVNATGLHFTTLSGLIELKANQGTAKQVSVMTYVKESFADDVFRRGIATDGGLVTELQGNISMDVPFDIYSQSDNQGRRWFNLERLSGAGKFGLRTFTPGEKNTTDFEDFLNDYTNDINSTIDRAVSKTSKQLRGYFSTIGFRFLLKNEGRKFFLEAKKWMDMLDPEDTIDLKGDSYQQEYDDSLQILNGALADLTKDLFDVAEKHLRKNIETVKYALLRSSHDRTSEWSDYTEGLMRDFTVEQVWYHSELMAQQISDPDVAKDLGLDVDPSDGTIEGISASDNDAFFAFIDLAERVLRNMFPGIPVIDGYQRDPVELFRKYGG